MSEIKSNNANGKSKYSISLINNSTKSAKSKYSTKSEGQTTHDSVENHATINSNIIMLNYADVNEESFGVILSETDIDSVCVCMYQAYVKHRHLLEMITFDIDISRVYCDEGKRQVIQYSVVIDKRMVDLYNLGSLFDIGIKNNIVEITGHENLHVATGIILRNFKCFRYVQKIIAHIIRNKKHQQAIEEKSPQIVDESDRYLERVKPIDLSDKSDLMQQLKNGDNILLVISTNNMYFTFQVYQSMEHTYDNTVTSNQIEYKVPSMSSTSAEFIPGLFGGESSFCCKIKLYKIQNSDKKTQWYSFPRHLNETEFYLPLFDHSNEELVEQLIDNETVHDYINNILHYTQMSHLMDAAVVQIGRCNNTGNGYSGNDMKSIVANISYKDSIRPRDSIVIEYSFAPDNFGRFGLVRYIVTVGGMTLHPLYTPKPFQTIVEISNFVKKLVQHERLWFYKNRLVCIKKQYACCNV